MNKIIEWFNNFGVETFSVNFYCKNCYKECKFNFPVGTTVIRAPYLGYDNSETRVVIPRKGASEHKTLKCYHCKVGNLA